MVAAGAMATSIGCGIGLPQGCSVTKLGIQSRAQHDEMQMDEKKNHAWTKPTQWFCTDWQPDHTARCCSAELEA